MQYKNKFKKMKQLNLKNTIIVAIILLEVLFTSFSPIHEKEETTLRNIEALSRGENSVSSSCINGEGRCIINGEILYGMRKKD